ncbi:hypothetical protein HJC22_18310 [Corallococcus exiguus]|uniref:hypothetical protein n=1 Tax=Corallococcus exiguus TaxID=83462 RepID=UPI0014711F94|nr:hypothetical protein [Corallococcus exiguus]NNC17675.1 hypothetical protein [Corallococcus exiguus]
MRHHRPRKPSPELQRHRQVRADFLRDLARLQGVAEPTPQPREIPPEERCPTCDGPTFITGYGRVCSLGLHDG